jgi:hypothetical protein
MDPKDERDRLRSLIRDHIAHDDEQGELLRSEYETLAANPTPEGLADLKERLRVHVERVTETTRLLDELDGGNAANDELLRRIEQRLRELEEEATDE